MGSVGVTVMVNVLLTAPTFTGESSWSGDGRETGEFFAELPINVENMEIPRTVLANFSSKPAPSNFYINQK